MLVVKNLSVTVGDKTVLKEINITIKDGETMVLFGPNGSGKSSLLKTIMGFDGYSIGSGEILLDGRRLNGLNIEERVRMGAGIMFQHPPKIRGVTLQQIVHVLSGDDDHISKLSTRLSLNELLSRDLNLGFSGGEMKRSELLQLLLQEPGLLLLDEPESGVDIENISLMGEVLRVFLQQRGRSALIITHTGYILDYIRAQRGCVMINGKLWCVGEPKKMFEDIKKNGYEKCRECICPQQSSPSA